MRIKTCSKENPCSILLVEDNKEQVLLFKSIVAMDGHGGFIVTHTDSIEVTLNLLETRPFDLILLDLFIRDSSGIETFTRLSNYVNKIPIIILTGFADEDVANKALEMGAQDYVIKGDLLGRAIINIIRRGVSRHQNIDEIMKICNDLRLRLLLLQGKRASINGDNENGVFNELTEIAERLEAKAQLIRMG